MGGLSWTRVCRRDFAKTVARVVVASHAVVCAARGEAAGADPPSDGAKPFRYERMSSERLARAIKQCRVAWISAGIVEWHGEQNACGLDGLKAETLCQMAAQLLGGVCFPHVRLGPDASRPFDPATYPRGTLTIDKPLYLNIARDLLSQIEAMGFQVAVWLSGHYPGVIPDVAKEYNRRGKLKVLSLSEHSFELSQSEAKGAVLLDLGVVENHCEVVINDTPPLVDHWLPYQYRGGSRLKAGSNKLKATVRHRPQPTLDAFYYRVAPPRLVGPVTLTFWNP